MLLLRIANHHCKLVKVGLFKQIETHGLQMSQISSGNSLNCIRLINYALCKKDTDLDIEVDCFDQPPALLHWPV